MTDLVEEIELKNVALRFFLRGTEDKPLTKGCLLIAKTDPQVADLRDAVKAVRAAWQPLKVSPDRLAFRDGDLEDWADFEGHFYVSWVNEAPGLGMAEPIEPGTLVNAKLILTEIRWSPGSWDPAVRARVHELRRVEKGDS